MDLSVTDTITDTSENEPDLHLGDTGDGVAAATEFFTRFGYFEDESLRQQYPGWVPIVGEPPAASEVFGDELLRAVRAFQTMSGLPVTGVIDHATRAVMNTPRCGVPDSLGISARDKWAANGNWRDDHSVTYWFGNLNNLHGPAGVTWSWDDALVHQHLSTAFSKWRSDGANQISDLTFTREFTEEDADIRIIFCSSAATPDCGNFDFAGALADANGSRIRVDTTNEWRRTQDTSGGFSFARTVAHEMGHSLGFMHTNISSDGNLPMMWSGAPSSTQLGELTPDDERGLAVSPYTDWRAAGSSALSNDLGASTVGTAEFVWRISNTSVAGGFSVFRWNDTSGTWQSPSNAGGGMRIDVAGRTPWVITSAGLAKQRSNVTAANPEGDNWTNRGDCNFVDIGANANGVVWAVGDPLIDGDYTVRRRVGNAISTNCSTADWVIPTDAGRARYIDVAPDGSPWIITTLGNIYQRVGVCDGSAGCGGVVNLNGTSWQSVEGVGKDIGMGSDLFGGNPTAWITSPTNNIYMRSDQGWHDINNNGEVDIDDPPDVHEWILPDNGGTGVAITVGRDSMPWVVGSSLAPWRRRP